MFCNRTGRAVGLGQFLSVLLTLTGTCATFLAKANISIPATQVLLSQILLVCTTSIYKLFLKKTAAIQFKQFYWFALISLFNLEADYLIIKAYNYASVTNVTLLSSFTVPCVMIFSYLFLHDKFSYKQIFGGSLSIVGVVVLVVLDSNNKNQQSYEQKQQLFGNCLVLMSSLIYASSNVMQERLLRDVDVIDVLMQVGVFGVFWGSIQSLVLERDQVVIIMQQYNLIFLVVLLSFALFLFYLLVPWAMILGGSTLFNLSLLTTQIWMVIIKVLFFEGFSTYGALVFSGSFVLVVSGIVIYSISGSNKNSQDAFWEVNVRDPLLDEESQ